MSNHSIAKSIPFPPQLFVQIKKQTGPNHVLKEDEMDKWDRLLDLFYVAKELVAECKQLLAVRKHRKEEEKRAAEARKRWKKLKNKGGMAVFMAKLGDVMTQKAKGVTVGDIERLYGSNSLFDFTNKQAKKSKPS